MIASNPDPNVVRVLTEARQRLNDATAPVDPRHAFRSTPATPSSARRSGAADPGAAGCSDTGKTAVRPTEMQDDIAGGPPGAQCRAVRRRLREGVRARARSHRRHQQERSAQAGKRARPAAGLERAETGGGVRSGSVPTADWMCCERERGFRQTYQDVVQGSQTAQRTAAKEALEAGKGKIPVETSLVGGTLRLAQEGLNRFRTGAAEANRDRIAQMMATRDPAETTSDHRTVAGHAARP